MNYRRITGLFGAAGAGLARLRLARRSRRRKKISVTSIANTVSGAVSSIATNSVAAAPSVAA